MQDSTCLNSGYGTQWSGAKYKKSRGSFAKKECKFFAKILRHLIHDRAGGEQVRRSLYHHGIVEVELHEGVLPCMVAVERPAAHSHGLFFVSVPVFEPADPFICDDRIGHEQLAQ